MTPSVLLGPACNHDLGLLLRLPPQSSTEVGTRSAAKAAATSTLHAMGTTNIIAFFRTKISLMLKAFS